ncbi:MAG: hypothetical protein Q8R82_07665 [Hyphomonadaceae bacterium]|nr:hypothetical protein [Hyphomonadaceae bacterium]
MPISITMPAMSSTMGEGKRSMCVGWAEIQRDRGLVAGWLVAGAVLLLALVAPWPASADTTKATAAHVSLYKELLVLVGDAQAVTYSFDDEKKRVEDAVKKHLGVASFTGAQQKKFDAVAVPVYKEAFENTLQDIASAEAPHFTADEIKGLIAAHQLPEVARYREVKFAPVADRGERIRKYLSDAVASIIQRYNSRAIRRPPLEYDRSAPVHKMLMATGLLEYLESESASYLFSLESAVLGSLGAIGDEDDAWRLEGLIVEESLRLRDWFTMSEMERFSYGMSPKDMVAINTALSGVAQDKLNQMQNGRGNVSRAEIFEGHRLKAVRRMEAEYRQ